MLWLVCLVAMPGAMLVQDVTSLGLGPITSIQAVSALTFLWFTLASTWPNPEARPRMLVLTPAVAAIVQTLVGPALGADLALSARVAVATCLQAGITLAYYRWAMGDDNLTPHRPSDVVNLAFGSLIAALAVVPLGPAEGVWVTSPVYELFWWVLLSTSHVFVAGACVLLLVLRHPRTEAIPTRLLLVYLQLVVTGAALVVVFTFDDLPLTWLVLLPAVWAGLSMGPWTAAAYALTAALTVVAAHAIPDAGRPYGGSGMTNILLLDSLMTAFVFIVVVLSLVRDQRAHLAEEVLARRQDALAQSALLNTVFEAIDEALVVMDPDGVVLLHNRAAEEILGPEHLVDEPGRWLRRSPQQTAFSYSFSRDGSEDRTRTLSVQLASVRYAGSAGVVAIARDTTLEQQRIEELSSFATVAAHDLKGPLTAVQGWLEVAEDVMGQDPRGARDALARGRSVTDNMSRELEDWLTYNVAREGVMRPEPVSLQPVVEAIAAHHPEVEFDILTPHSVYMDPTLLRHLLANLIGNAAKYTLEGQRPQVSMRTFSGSTSGWVRLHVVDAGIGIPPGEEEAVFEPFRRATGVERYAGSGLGLALCKRVVRRHGGVIKAQNNEGPGTTITVTLPSAH